MIVSNEVSIERDLLCLLDQIGIPTEILEPEQWSEDLIAQLAAFTSAAKPEHVQETICVLMRSVRDGIQRIKQAEIEAVTDPLTGLYNRKYFMARMEEILFQLMRYPEESAAMAFIDLNKFKPINDTYGHEAGDAVLIRVAEILDEFTRRHETVVRLGGDEFCILFAPREESSNERVCAEEASARLQKLFDDLSVQYNGTVIEIGASIGVIKIDPDLSADENLHAADVAMYETKKALGHTRH